MLLSRPRQMRGYRMGEARVSRLRIRVRLSLTAVMHEDRGVRHGRSGGELDLTPALLGQYPSDVGEGDGDNVHVDPVRARTGQRGDERPHVLCRELYVRGDEGDALAQRCGHSRWSHRDSEDVRREEPAVEPRQDHIETGDRDYGSGDALPGASRSAPADISRDHLTKEREPPQDDGEYERVLRSAPETVYYAARLELPALIIMSVGGQPVRRFVRVRLSLIVSSRPTLQSEYHCPSLRSDECRTIHTNAVRSIYFFSGLDQDDESSDGMP